MIQPAFKHESVGPLTKMIAAVNAKLLRKWQLAARSNESVNVTRDVSAMALEVVLRFIFGEDYDQVGFHFDLLSEEKARDLDFVSSFRALGDVILQVVERRRKDNQDLATSNDALGMLMNARDPDRGQPMPDRQLINEILTMIVAGHETTASTLNWTWYLLSQHPEVEQRLSNELNSLPPLSGYEALPKFLFTRQIIDEAMRLYPAGWMVSRKALHADRLGAFFVPAGTEIYVPIYFIQRHPDLWEDPDRFNPDRFRPELSKQRHRLASVPFSAGPRNCIGELFARTEMQIHLLTIARHLRLRYTQSGPMEFDAGVNLRSRHDILMYPEAKSVARSEGTPAHLDSHTPGQAFN
jgi:cytochrome P450